MPEVIIAGNTVTFDSIAAGSCTNLDVSGDTVSLGLDMDAIRERIRSSAVYSINGVYGRSDGSFFINGSDCDSWGYIEGSTAFPMNEQPPIYKYDEDGVMTDVPDTEASGIWITDLCPACQTCDEIYQIKQGIEQLDVFINMIKDVELHDDAQLQANKAELEALAIDGGTQCTNSWGIIDPMKGMQLLQQYITVAHMWNYAVVQNNASFKLEIAPEDTAGFVVQTKRALPNCDENWWIRCTITITYDQAISDSGVPVAKQDLSVYVPEPILHFKPFTHYDAESSTGLPESVEPIGGGTATTIYADDAALNGAKATLTYPVPGVSGQSYTRKVIQTDRIVARVSGTYEVTVKVLPFRNCVLRDENGDVVTIRGALINITGQTTADGKYVVYPGYTCDPESPAILNPTKEDYLNAKTAPSVSVPLNNVWKVHIIWEVGEVGDTSGYNYFEYEETRLYTCTGARDYAVQAAVTGSTVPVDIEIEPSTSSIAGV